MNNGGTLRDARQMPAPEQAPRSDENGMDQGKSEAVMTAARRHRSLFHQATTLKATGDLDGAMRLL